MVSYRTYKAILNPTREQLTPGPKPNCYGCALGLWRERVPGVRSVTLGEWRPPRERLELRIPRVPPGRYLLALYDGSEGGTHYTWDFVEVREVGGGEGGVPVGALLALGAVAAILLGLVTARRVFRPN